MLYICYLQNIKHKSKPVISSQDSKTLDKLCEWLLIPKIRYELTVD